MGWRPWDIWDLWEYRGRRESYEDNLTVTGSGTFTYELPFIPDEVHAQFTNRDDYDYDDQDNVSCVPIGRDHLRIRNYFRLVVISWKLNPGETRIINWRARN